MIITSLNPRVGHGARFVEFTDAVELDIPLKFYVELKNADRIVEMLRHHNINTERDVLYFDGRDFEVPYSFLGKKLAMFNDSQFTDYEWVWLMDSDMFMSSPNRTKYGLFSELLASPMEIGASSIYPFDHDETFIDKHWWWRAGDSSATDEDKQKECLRRIASVVPPEIVTKYTTQYSTALQIGGWLYSFPASEFLSKRRQDCEWIYNAGKVTQEDECVFSLWESLGNPLVNLSEIVEVPIIIDHKDVTKYFEKGDPYIVHVGMAPFQHHWRAGFDAL